MSAVDPATPKTPAFRQVLVEALREEGSIWLLVIKTLVAFFLTGWIAMRLELPSPSSAMLTTIIVANRQSGMVLAKSFYRGIGTVVGAILAVVIVAAFAQQRVLFLLSLSLWIGLCSAGATLYRNFKSYAFVLAGYTAALVAVPVINAPLNVFDSAWARLSEVLLGLLVSGVVSEAIFPARMRDVMRRTGREQFTDFIAFVRGSVGGAIPREQMENAHLRFVRAAVTLEDLRSSVVFEDVETRARSNHLRLFNQRFMATSTSFQSLHHLINRLKRAQRERTADALIRLYAPLGKGLEGPLGAGLAAQALLPQMTVARDAIAANVAPLRGTLDDAQDLRDFDTGAALIRRFADELYDYIEAAASLQSPRPYPNISAERVSFDRGNDYLGAGIAMVRATLTMLVLGLFWIESAWPFGSSAMLLATVFAGLFATVPNPTRVTWIVMLGYLSGMIMAFICLFFVLTQVDGFGLLVVSVFPFAAVGLVMMFTPSLASYGLGWSFGLTYLLGLNNMQVFDPARAINDAIAQIIGLGAAAAAFVIIPPAIGSAWLRRRLMARLRAQVALAAEAPLPGLRHRFESINNDLVSQVVAQTQPGSADSRALIAWSLAVHETGRALVEMRHDMAVQDIPSTLRPYLDAVLDRLSRFYEVPDVASYVAARDAVATAIEGVREHTGQDYLLENLNLIRMTLLDSESAVAAYMPDAPLAKEITHAP
ncbi:FUSC family protein [Luteibacter sp. CQ10]|uniref:FUSC family protein n=1 Tax=Luteibacter sp. CQ10 TaxID=2805821 RepID=UPI0034A5C6B4